MLEVGKVYRALPPESKDPPYGLRVIDEDGEDYLYPAEWFMPLRLDADERQTVEHALPATA